MSEFDSLSDASAAAMSSIEAGGDTPAAPSVPDTVVPEVPPTPDPTQPPVPDFKASKHKVKVRGQEEEVDYEELVKGYSRQADYTRSKQELSRQLEQAQQLEQTIRQREQSLQQMFGSDPLMQTAAQVAEAYKVPFTQALQAVVQHQLEQGQQIPSGVQGANDSLATLDQAQAIAQQQVQQMQQQMQLLQRQLEEKMQRTIQATKAEIQTSHQAQEYAQEVNTTLSDIFTKNPVLTAVEGMEDLLRFKVYQADPATVEEAKDLFVRFATEQAERLNHQFTELNKDRLVAKDRLTSGGIEPPGGAGVTPQPANHKFGSRELRDSAEQYVKSLMR